MTWTYVGKVKLSWLGFFCFQDTFRSGKSLTDSCSEHVSKLTVLKVNLIRQGHICFFWMMVEKTYIWMINVKLFLPGIQKRRQVVHYLQNFKWKEQQVLCVFCSCFKDLNWVIHDSFKNPITAVVIVVNSVFVAAYANETGHFFVLLLLIWQCLKWDACFKLQLLLQQACLSSNDIVFMSEFVDVVGENKFNSFGVSDHVM